MKSVLTRAMRADIVASRSTAHSPQEYGTSENQETSSFCSNDEGNFDKERKYVQHSYHDYSLIQKEDSLVANLRTMSKGRGVSIPFPVKLFNMLAQVHDDTTCHGLDQFVCWQSHGRAFRVLQKNKFEEIILPRFFKQGKYTSFQRQLNIYGFKRITRGADQGSYYHELFLHGRKYLSYGIERVSVKGNGARMASNPASEPDFYKMMPVSYYNNDCASTVQGNGARMASNPASEPDFPQMMPVSYHSNDCEVNSTTIITSASTVQGNGARTTSNPASEQDFSKMTPVSYHSNDYEGSSTTLTTSASTSDGGFATSSSISDDFATSSSITDDFATSSDNLNSSSIVEGVDGLSMLYTDEWSISSSDKSPNMCDQKMFMLIRERSDRRILLLGKLATTFGCGEINCENC